MHHFIRLFQDEQNVCQQCVPFKCCLAIAFVELYHQDSTDGTGRGDHGRGLHVVLCEISLRPCGAVSLPEGVGFGRGMSNCK